MYVDFGGVVLEIVVCVYVECVDIGIDVVLNDVNVILFDIDVIVVIVGLGLIGGVLLGVMVVKGLLMVMGILLIGVNYFVGYVLMFWLIDVIFYLYLMLFVFGGYC